MWGVFLVATDDDASNKLVSKIYNSTVAGLMNSTALDVAYSLFAAPAGNRLPMLYEMIGSGVLLTLLAAIKVLLGPKKVK